MKRLVILLVALLVITGCSAGKPIQSQTPPTPEPAVPPIAQPTLAPVEPVLTEGPLYLLAAPQNPLWAGPIAVVVENSPQARPQSGLAQADLVVEALAESEISRFLAFYWGSPAEKIGPVRSARTGSVLMAEAYDAPFAHAGGNTDALAMTQWRTRDLDEIYGGWEFFYRSKDREPPHNLYTTTGLLDTAVISRKLEMKPVPTTERAPAMPAPGQTATQVTVAWHKYHQVSWEWLSDGYLRFEDGQPHQLESGQQIQAVNLVFLNITGENSGPDLGWTLYFKQGGKATVLTAGHQWEGTWSLENGGFRLTPSGGKVPLLAPGPAWIHLITQESGFQVKGSTP